MPGPKATLLATSNISRSCVATVHHTAGDLATSFHAGYRDAQKKPPMKLFSVNSSIERPRGHDLHSGGFYY